MFCFVLYCLFFCFACWLFCFVFVFVLFCLFVCFCFCFVLFLIYFVLFCFCLVWIQASNYLNRNDIHVKNQYFHGSVVSIEVVMILCIVFADFSPSEIGHLAVAPSLQSHDKG